jgi:ArsR family transcriptional regulator
MSKYKREMIHRAAAAFKALSNPHRLRIFLKLASCCCPELLHPDEEQGACVGDLGEGIDIALSTLSHHVKELRYAGLVECSKDGKEVICCINRELFDEIICFLRDACAPAERTTDPE